MVVALAGGTVDDGTGWRTVDMVGRELPVEGALVPVDATVAVAEVWLCGIEPADSAATATAAVGASSSGPDEAEEGAP